MLAKSGTKRSTVDTHKAPVLLTLAVVCGLLEVEGQFDVAVAIRAVLQQLFVS